MTTAQLKTACSKVLTPLRRKYSRLFLPKGGGPAVVKMHRDTIAVDKDLMEAAQQLFALLTPIGMVQTDKNDKRTMYRICCKFGGLGSVMPQRVGIDEIRYKSGEVFYQFYAQDLAKRTAKAMFGPYNVDRVDKLVPRGYPSIAAVIKGLGEMHDREDAQTLALAVIWEIAFLAASFAEKEGLVSPGRKGKRS